MNNKLLLPLVISVATTAGCSLAPYQKAKKAPTPAPRQQTASPAPVSKSEPVPAPRKSVKASIYAQYREWKGTRYRLGGMSKRGVDCSALVYLTYRDHMGIKLPRTTEYQVLAGEAVTRGQLRAGDLVFFKTGRRDRHVGIYIEDGKFFHASTSRGVTISKLSDYYWKNRYWRARRLNLEAES